jgi:hypothetical protein
MGSEIASPGLPGPCLEMRLPVDLDLPSLNNCLGGREAWDRQHRRKGDCCPRSRGSRHQDDHDGCHDDRTDRDNELDSHEPNATALPTLGSVPARLGPVSLALAIFPAEA